MRKVPLGDKAAAMTAGMVSRCCSARLAASSTATASPPTTSRRWASGENTRLLAAVLREGWGGVGGRSAGLEGRRRRRQQRRRRQWSGTAGGPSASALTRCRPAFRSQEVRTGTAAPPACGLQQWQRQVFSEGWGCYQQIQGRYQANAAAQLCSRQRREHKVPRLTNDGERHGSPMNLQPKPERWQWSGPCRPRPLHCMSASVAARSDQLQAGRMQLQRHCAPITVHWEPTCKRRGAARRQGAAPVLLWAACRAQRSAAQLIQLTGAQA